MNPVTKAFADALAQNAGIVVGVVVTALVAVIEAARRWAVAKFAQSAVDTHGDEHMARAQVRSLPRALRPLRKGNVAKVVAKAMLKRKLKSEAEHVAAINATLAADEDKTPTVPPPGDSV